MENAASVMVGVGLRHEHYFDAINDIAPIDFVEIHAENFFIDGGPVKDILRTAAQHYKFSVHATSLGLGSVQQPDDEIIMQLSSLCDEVDPFLLSDHACFNRALVHGKQIHTGDLLPLRYNQASLDILAAHIDLIQNRLGRTLLIENLSAYLPQETEAMSEFSFLTALCKKTGCKLLLDLNNVLVNQYNDAVLNSSKDYQADIDAVMNDLAVLDSSLIGEIHLAGTTPAAKGELMIDDHANTVSHDCWKLYSTAINVFGPIPTLIEWDQSLPTWRELVALATKAKDIQQATLA